MKNNNPSVVLVVAVITTSMPKPFHWLGRAIFAVVAGVIRVEQVHCGCHHSECIGL
jgi:hypothetical protein